MTRRNLLLKIFPFLSVVGIMHISATVFDLYWRIWWFDNPTHFVGGIFTSLLMLWMCYFSGYVRRANAPTKTDIFICMVGGTIVIGVAWEIFENIIGMTWSAEGYRLDVALDMVMNVLGACLGFLTWNKEALKSLALPPEDFFL